MSQPSTGPILSYGHFDDTRREYVITKPLTPRPWINYVSNSRMGAIVSQGAGGLAWFHQPVSQRISRYDFMGLPEDRPGFYVYIREADGTYWNPSFQPCQTPLDRWQCRHGMGYTRYVAERAGLVAELVLFVPPDDDVLLWDLTIHNNRDTAQSLFVANYIEFSLYEYFKEVLGWIVLRNQVRFLYDPDVHAIKYHYFVYEAEHTQPVFLTGSGTPVGHDCDRPAFIGRGRDTANPIAVERARLSNSTLPGGGMGIGSLAYEPTIEPGASARIVWCLGAADDWDQADRLAVKYHDLHAADDGRRQLDTFWADLLAAYQADLPDPETQSMVNVWNPYGAYTTFFRDRDISTELTGVSSGIRFRDAMQNCMSVCHLAPPVAKDRIELLLRHQWADGHTPNAFRPGVKQLPAAGGHRCDSPVWSPITLYGYLSETGDFAFLDRRLPYLDEGEGTVYDHLMAGLHQIARDSGDDGLPLLKGRDWDDHLELFGEEGAQSVMTAQNWCYAGRLMKAICLHAGRPDDATWIDGQIATYTDALNGPAWDGQWYRQVLYRGGKTPLGSKDRRENKIYINTQAWAVISGTAPPERAALCLDKMREHLDSRCGIRFLVPPYTGIPEPEDPLVSNGPCLGENGGIFIQANCWAIMAEATLGRGDRAYHYYRQIAPPVLSEHVGPDVYLNEPYMYSSHIIAEPDARAGMANLSWLTGAVNWMYIVATQFILGVRPTLDGLSVQPCLPSCWPKVHVTRRYRGATYEIDMVNTGAGRVTETAVDGARVDGPVLPLAPAGQTVRVQVAL